LPATILTLSTAAVFLYGGRMVIEGALSIGSLVAFMTYHLRLLAPVQSMLGTWATLATARVSLDRVFELMDTRVEVCELPGARAISEVRGELVFEHVSLRHDRNVVLEDVSFRVAPGEICAIVGPSGVGKSTLADLAIRLLDPDSGTVRLDGDDLRELRLADIRRSIAVVEQTPFLFHATLEENIAYARPGATHEEIVEGARCACIHDFIASLPDGYNTIAGERGLSLSAGERQRIAIARAILRRPRILVLDEPTAALDTRTETDLASALARALEGRTAVIITHRPSLAALASQQVRLEGGRVAEVARMHWPRSAGCSGRQWRESRASTSEWRGRRRGNHRRRGEWIVSGLPGPRHSSRGGDL
jgi:ATP-binding cassette subfamily B protein